MKKLFCLLALLVLPVPVLAQEVAMNRAIFRSTGTTCGTSGTAGPQLCAGTGAPEGVVSGPEGSIYLRTNGETWRKSSGLGTSTGWLLLLAGTLSGNTTTLVTLAGAATSGECAQFDANGNVAAAGAGCGGSGGSDYHVGATLDGGGSAITTGWKGCSVAAATGTITGVYLYSTDAATPTTGSIALDIWKVNDAGYPPTVANTIVAAAPPTISSSNKGSITTLTGWTTAVAAGDSLCYSVSSVTSLTKVNVWVRIQP